MSNFLMSVWVSFLRLIFTFLHIVYSSMQYFDIAWVNFRRKIDAFLAFNATESELYVSRFVTSLEKCPRHLALIVGNEAIKCEDFTNIVIWSLAAGISILTVYDHSGKILENESKLFSHIVKNAKVIPENVIFKNLRLKNGISKDLKHKIIINVLKEPDGRQVFTNLVLRLSTKNSTVIDQKFITEEINSTCKAPEPDAALITGPVISTYGYPPWDIRLTEFLRLRQLDGVSVVEFCNLLKTYSNCEQRRGK